MMMRASFEALYQQSPIVVGGGMFPIEQFKPIQRLNKALIKRSIRYIDKAGTEGDGAYTAGVLMHEMRTTSRHRSWSRMWGMGSGQR